MTKCPYVPPHPWNVDFPHLMLRAKAARFRSEGAPARDRILRVDRHGGLDRRHPGHRPGGQCRSIAPRRAVACSRRCSACTRRRPSPFTTRDPVAGASRAGRVPPVDARPGAWNRGRVALFATCYCNRNEPDIAEDLAVVFRHNAIAVRLVPRERCCGMPRLELGDLDAVRCRANGSTFRCSPAWSTRAGTRRARAVLRADVQAGAAAALSR